MVATSFDVGVVGGGPAGATAAWLLARQGFRVLLVERARMPRPKPCGDGVSPAAVAMLDRLGLLSERELAQQFHPVARVRFVADAASACGGARFNPRRGDGSPVPGYVAPRRDFDRMLFERAAGGVATVSVGDPVQHLELEPEGALLRARSGRTWRCRYVVGADGAHSAVRKALGLPSPPERRRAVAIRTYVQGAVHLDAGRLEVFKPPALQRGYAWIFPTGPQSANVGIGFRTDALRRSGGSLRSTLQAFLQSTPSLAGAEIAGPTQGWPLPLGAPVLRLHGSCAVLCGDAGSMVDPLSGEGIYHAIRSAEIAAGVLGAALRGRGGLGAYSRRVHAEFSTEFLLGCLLHEAIEWPALVRFGLGVAAARPAVADAMAAAFGHGAGKLELLGNPLLWRGLGSTSSFPTPV